MPLFDRHQFDRQFLVGHLFDRHVLVRQTCQVVKDMSLLTDICLTDLLLWHLFDTLTWHQTFVWCTCPCPCLTFVWQTRLVWLPFIWQMSLLTDTSLFATRDTHLSLRHTLDGTTPQEDFRPQSQNFITQVYLVIPRFDANREWLVVRITKNILDQPFSKI